MTRRTWIPLATPLALAALVGVASPAAAAPAGPLVQAETLRPASGRVIVTADRAASAGRFLNMVTRSSVRTAMTTTTHADRLVLRVKGDQAYGAPVADVLVDGRRAGTFSVPGTRWYDATLRGSWAAGEHVVEVRFVNDAMIRGRDRNLHLDRITFGASTQAPAAGSPSNVLSAQQAFEDRVTVLVNAERAKAGLAPLAPLACATATARDWSATMARTGRFEHRDLDGVRAGCERPDLRGWGENIAYGDRTTADRMMQMWMASPGHRANILNASYTHLGVGVVIDGRQRAWGTQNFYRLG